MNITNLSDYDLIKRFREENDHHAIEVLINRHKRKIFSHIFLLTKDKELAEDLFQDTFIKVIKSLKQGKYTEEGKFLSWVIRVAHNLALDYFRKQKHLRTISNDDCEMDLFNCKDMADATIEDIIIEKQICKEIRDIIDELPHDQKEVIVLRHFSKMSFKEIAEITNVSINTALGRMRYALINLRKIIEERKLVLTPR